MSANLKRAKRFDESLKKRNLSDSDVSKRTNVSKNTIANWRNGFTSPSVDDFLHVCDTLNLDIPYILCLNESESILRIYSNLDERYRDAIDVIIRGLVKNDYTND